LIILHENVEGDKRREGGRGEKVDAEQRANGEDGRMKINGCLDIVG